MHMLAAAHIEELLAQHRFREACIRMESALLDGVRLREAWLRRLPDASLQASPLLLQELGELYLRAGRLQQSKTLLQSAVKGYSAMAFPDRLLTAMASLARVMLRIGELAEAETLLLFLKEEHERKPEAERSDGSVPWALASGSRLIDSQASAAGWYMEAVDCFERKLEYDEASSALADLLLDHSIGPESSRNGLTWRVKQWSSVREDAGLHTEWPLALFSLRSEEWTHVYAQLKSLLNTAWQTEAAYNHAAHAHAILLLASLQLYPDEAGDRLRMIQSLRSKHAADLELAHRLLIAEHAGWTAMGYPDEAAAAMSEAGSIGRYLKLAGMHDIPRLNDPMTSGTHAVPPQRGRSQGRWSVRMFGGLSFERGADEIRHIRWKRRKAQELCICLLLQPRYTCPKEQLIEILQLGEDTAKAVRQLYVIVHQLKQTLHEELGIEDGVSTREGLVMLREDAFEYVDVERYQALLRVAEPLWSRDRALSHEFYQEAYMLYAEPLPELPYLSWLDNWRAYLLDRQAAVIRKLRRLAEEKQDSASEEAYCLEWIRISPYAEDAHEQLIKLFMRQQRYGEARLAYDKYAEMCEAEWGTEPSEDIRSLIRRGSGEGNG
jgi:two-component SAPR family response regulator